MSKRTVNIACTECYIGEEVNVDISHGFDNSLELARYAAGQARLRRLVSSMCRFCGNMLTTEYFVPDPGENK
jgi:hypothetical protein